MGPETVWLMIFF